MDDKGKRKLSVDKQIDDFVWKMLNSICAQRKKQKTF